MVTDKTKNKAAGRGMFLTARQISSWFVNRLFSCHFRGMTITQTVEIPADRRSITIEIPREIPAGKRNIVFFPSFPDKGRIFITNHTNMGKSSKGSVFLSQRKIMSFIHWLTFFVFFRF